MEELIEEFEEIREDNRLTHTKRKRKINFDINFNFIENKPVIYSIIFYCCGLFLGSYFYKIASSESLDKILAPENNSVINLFAQNVCIYFSLFLLVVFLGFCLIGYPIINAVPAVVGINYGLKLGYLFVNHLSKGVAYSIIMIVPFVAMFLTIIVYAIQISAQMSKELMDITKDGLANGKYDLKPHLKKLLILGMCIIGVSFISAGLTSLLFGVVTI